ncbi:MAG: sensor histidine kinase [Methanobacterium sp.]
MHPLKIKESRSININNIALFLAIIIVLGYIAVTTLLAYDPDLRKSVSDILSPLISFLVVISLFWAGKSSKVYGRRIRTAWLFLAAAQASFTIGEIIWAVLEIGLNQTPFPSYADIFYTLFYLLFAIGILLLPRTNFKTAKFKTAIDISIVMISSALIFWIFLIIPTLQSSKGNNLAIILSLNYIVADFVLLFVLLDMLFNRIKNFKDKSLLLLSAGILALIFTDTSFAYQSLHGIYVSGGLMDSGWILGYVLIGLAGVYQVAKVRTEPDIKHSDPSVEEDKFFWISYIPFIWVLVAYILLLWGYYQSYTSELLVLELGVGTILVLIIIRQIISLRENRRLYLEAQKEINLRKNAQNELKETLNEKDLLVKEIHHRVKNNLTVFSSLLNLQSRYIKDKEALDIFKESQDRAKSMAIIHEDLYQSSDFKRINFGEYINKLSINLFQTYVTNPDLINLNIDAEEVMLDINLAIPLGLILNELVTNVMKHAFKVDKKGEIKIKFHSKEGEYTLTVSDNGIGFPEGLDYKNIDSLGLKLVNSLTDQISGKIELDKTHGTTFNIIFREPEFK